jgi:uncharacterized membrane protein YjgN (DUF898 family)
MTEGDAPQSAFAFTGDWREFAPIAFTNLLLTIVTLGIYSFWARTRVRRYLWSRTQFIDDRLDWAGTGLELFIGYILAFFLFIVPLGVIQLVVQGILLHGHPGAAGLLLGLLYLFLLYMVGIAIFRALRYRLSRTYWHGIRGGSDDQGFGYGWAHFWRTIVGTLAAGLMIPWSMTNLWNARWNAMSFGPHAFRADARWQPIFSRFLLYYLVPIIIFLGGLLIFAIGAATVHVTPGQPPAGSTLAAFAVLAIAFYVIFFGVLGVIAMIYYAAYFREAVGKLSLGELDFAFGARTTDWIRLFLGNIGLVIVTFGIGYIFLAYRNWAFFVRHLEAYGEVRLDDLTQSTTRQPGQGEGLLDAFDIGAF